MCKVNIGKQCTGGNTVVALTHFLICRHTVENSSCTYVRRRKPDTQHGMSVTLDRHVTFNFGA